MRSCERTYSNWNDRAIESFSYAYTPYSHSYIMESDCQYPNVNRSFYMIILVRFEDFFFQVLSTTLRKDLTNHILEYSLSFTESRDSLLYIHLLP